MKTFVLWLAKKYIVSAVNDTIVKYKDNVLKITNKITLWTERLEKIILQLKKINARVADGKITKEEIVESMSELDVLVKEF